MAPFLKAALEGGFKEAEDAVIDMPNERPSVVRRFRLWAYTGQVLQAAESIEHTSWGNLIGLYVFADKYDLPDLQNAVIDTIVAKELITKKIPVDCFPVIYNETDAASPLRRLLIDTVAQKANLADDFTPEKSDENLEIFPPIFLLDLASALYKLKRGITTKHDWKNLGCTFHIHPSMSTESKQGLRDNHREIPETSEDAEHGVP